MAIHLLASTAGAPGGTTVALGLALTWPRPVLLVDADPSADQAILAGYLAGQASRGKGLLRVAEAHRDRRPLVEVVLDQAVTLAEDEGTRRMFLPGFARPTSADHFAPIWDDLAEAFTRLADVGMDVLVDLGRLTAAGPPAALVDRSAVVGLTLDSSLRGVMSARVHLAALRELVAAQDQARLGLVVVGEGRPYGRAEIGRALELPLLGTVAWDPAAAAHLSHGEPRPRRFESSRFGRSLRELSQQLAERAHADADLIASSR